MSWMQALESQTTHTAPSTADLPVSHPCSTFSQASKPAPIALIMPFERVAAHWSSLICVAHPFQIHCCDATSTTTSPIAAMADHLSRRSAINHDLM